MAVEADADVAARGTREGFFRAIRRRRWPGQWHTRLPLHVLLIGAMLIWSIPTLALFVSSFRDPSAVASSGWWNVFKELDNLTLDNYDAVLNQRNMGRAFFNSLLITVPATVLTILVAAFAAYAVAWMPMRFGNSLFLLMVALLVVPLQMTLIPVLQLYANIADVPLIGTLFDNELPLIGGHVFGVSSYPGIWVAHVAFGLPFAIFLLRNFFVALPRDLFEAAYLDGASDWQVFWTIVLPLARPALAALAIFQFLWTWNDLLVALTLLGDPELAPMTLQITNLVSSFGTDYQLLTAAAFVSMTLPLVFFFAFQRFFVEGITAGAVKG